jgi:hypothetical protein
LPPCLLASLPSGLLLSSSSGLLALPLHSRSKSRKCCSGTLRNACLPRAVLGRKKAGAPQTKWIPRRSAQLALRAPPVQEECWTEPGDQASLLQGMPPLAPASPRKITKMRLAAAAEACLRLSGNPPGAAAEERWRFSVSGHGVEGRVPASAHGKPDAAE